MSSARTLLTLVLLAACAPEPFGEGPAGDSDDGAGSDGGGSGDGSSGDGGSGDGGSGDGGSGDGGSDDGGSADGGGTGGEGLAGTMRLWTSTNVMLPETESGAAPLSVLCLEENDGALAIVEDATVEISPSDGVTDTGSGWSFAAEGIYTVSCILGSDVAEAEVQVIGEVMDRDGAVVAGALAGMERALIDVLLADGGADEDLVAAHAALQAAPELLPAEIPRPERNLPEAFWPDAASLEAAGVVRTADDDQLGPAILDLGAAISEARTTLAGLDPSTPSEEQASAMTAQDAAIEAAAATLSALEPTMHGWSEHGDALQSEVLEPLVMLSTETTAWHTAQLEATAGEVLPPFGLLSLVSGQALQGSLRLNLASHLYSDVIAQIDLSINNLIAIGAISTALPPTGDLYMDYVYASSSLVYAVPGYDTRIYGSGFSENPAMNQIFIVGVDWQGTVDTILDGCGLGSGSLIERLEAARDCIDSVSDTAEASFVDGTGVANDGVLSDQVLYMGPFPDVCGTGWVPVTIGLMAMNLETGSRSEFQTLTCLP